MEEAPTSSKLDPVVQLIKNRVAADPALLNPFYSREVRNWFADAIFPNKPPDPQPFLLLLGHGPFQAEELAGFLEKWEINSYTRDLGFGPSEDPPEEWRFFTSFTRPVVVVGEKEYNCAGQFLIDGLCLDKPLGGFPLPFPFWIERNNIEDKIIFTRSRTLHDVKFISQQMFLASLFTGRDWDDPLPEPWAGHARNHAGLKYLQGARKDGFAWPSTQASPGVGDLPEERDWPQIGLLAYAGYNVGVNGKPEQLRRRILAHTFERQILPKLESQQYILEWGSACSAARLKKMAYSIAAFCKNAKRRNDSTMGTAIQEWEADLAWLKVQYYEGKFDGAFPWPKSSHPG